MNESPGSFHKMSFKTKCLLLKAVKSRQLHCVTAQINCRITGVTSLVHLRCCARSANGNGGPQSCLSSLVLSPSSVTLRFQESFFFLFFFSFRPPFNSCESARLTPPGLTATRRQCHPHRGHALARAHALHGATFADASPEGRQLVNRAAFNLTLRKMNVDGPPRMQEYKGLL